MKFAIKLIYIGFVLVCSLMLAGTITNWILPSGTSKSSSTYSDHKRVKSAEERRLTEMRFQLSVLDGRGCGWLTSSDPICQQVARCERLQVPYYACPAIQAIARRIEDGRYPFKPKKFTLPKHSPRYSKPSVVVKNPKAGDILKAHQPEVRTTPNNVLKLHIKKEH